MRDVGTTLPGLVLIEPVVHGDARGFFLESYREDRLAELGVREQWRQDNHARSGRGVLRGMHFALPPGQAKLVRCVRGAIVDVCVDIRRGSPTYGRWEAFELDDVAHRMIYVPVGFAHGYCVVSEVADVTYKCSHPLRPGPGARVLASSTAGSASRGRDIPPIVSARDRDAPLLADIAPDLPFTFAA